MIFNQNYDQDIPYISYNSANKDYARFNRKNQTKAEGLMWNCILKGDKTGFRFVRQKTLGGFIADFYCSKLLLVIEVDGGYHNEFQEEDKNREIWMNSKGIKTVRFINDDVENNIDGVASEIEEIIKNRSKELCLKISPSPFLSRGEIL